jgi:hypothetical protein
VADLLIGLVTHARSRFPESAGPTGAAARIASAMTADVATMTCADDLLDADAVDLTPDTVASSARDYSDVQRRWIDYLAAGRPSAASRVFHRATAHLRLAAAEAVHRRGASADGGAASLARLLNIELAHLAIMQAALDSGAAWTLIIEDDATCTDATEIARNLTALMALPAATRPWLVDLSRSFTPRELGTEHLLSPAPFAWQGPVARDVLVASRPVTNTVCANLYSPDFLPALMRRWRALPLTPVVPIDWKLNRILMDMHRAGQFAADRCWNVEPGPLVQGSLHAAPVSSDPT